MTKVNPKYQDLDPSEETSLDWVKFKGVKVNITKSNPIPQDLYQSVLNSLWSGQFQRGQGQEVKCQRQCVRGGRSVKILIFFTVSSMASKFKVTLSFKISHVRCNQDADWWRYIDKKEAS